MTRFLAALTIATGLVLSITTDGTPRCFEDEVIVWTDTAHDRCVPLDDLVGGRTPR